MQLIPPKDQGGPPLWIEHRIRSVATLCRNPSSNKIHILSIRHGPNPGGDHQDYRLTGTVLCPRKQYLIPLHALGQIPGLRVRRHRQPQARRHARSLTITLDAGRKKNAASSLPAAASWGILIILAQPNACAAIAARVGGARGTPVGASSSPLRASVIP